MGVTTCSKLIGRREFGKFFLIFVLFEIVIRMDGCDINIKEF
jgi:hypothetical protein